MSDMSRTVTISDSLYDRLESETQSRGLTSIEQLLEEWARRNNELRSREEAVRDADRLRERLSTKYGQMPDSVELIREDRDR
jgi:hypothetical protein